MAVCDRAPLAVAPSLDALADDPTRAAALPRDLAAQLLTRAALAHSRLLARLLQGEPATATTAKAETDVFIGPEEVTKRFGLTAQWLKRHRALLRARRILSTPSRKESLYHAARLRRLLEERTALSP